MGLIQASPTGLCKVVVISIGLVLASIPTAVIATSSPDDDQASTGGNSLTISTANHGLDFTHPSYNGTIFENTIGKVYVQTPTRMGIRLPPSTVVDIEYEIVFGDSREIFKADTKTVKDFCFLRIRTRTGIYGMLNREFSSEYALRVSAKLMFPNEVIHEILTDVIVTVLDRNEFSPLFPREPYQVSIPEDTDLHSSIGLVKASDADVGINGEIYYSFVQETLMFAIHPTTGVVSLSRPVSYYHKKVYELDVVARDRAVSASGRGVNSPMSYTKFTVNIIPVNFKPPRIKVQPHRSLIEDGNIGSVFAILTVTDEDKGVNGIVGGVSIADDPGNIFRLTADEIEGKYNLEVVSPVDRESISPHYNITVKAWDKGSLAKTSSVVIPVRVQDINDNAPVFDRDVYNANVSEVVPVSTPVLFVTATDRDIGSNADVVYSIVGGHTKERFQINSKTGLIRTAKPLDHEIENRIVLIVQAEDQALSGTRFSGTAKIVISVDDFNDNDPVFESPSQPVEVKEQVPIGTRVVTVSASDGDSGDNGRISFSIVNFQSVPFEIDAFSGDITTTTIFDYETDRKVFYLHVRASDWGFPLKRETDTVVTVKVQNVNDNSPAFERMKCTGYLSRESPVNTEVVTLTAIDFDSDNQVTYSLTEGNGDDCFSIDPKSGMISVSCDMTNYYDVKRHLVIVASDGQHVSIPVTLDLNLVTNKRTPLSAMDDVRVSCDSTNVVARYQRQMEKSKTANLGNAPPTLNESSQFTNTPPTISDSFSTAYDVEESESIGNAVFDFKKAVHDADMGYNGILTFVISQGDDKDGRFKLDTFSGQLVVLSPLDHETKPEYRLRLTAMDMGRPQLNVSRDVLISVLDKNDNAPRFRRILYSRTISESALINTTVVHVEATDADKGENGNVQYSIISNDEAFSIDRSSGTITLKTNLDRETRNVHTLIVQAEDSSSSEVKLSSTTVVKITVTDINDNPPVFIPRKYVIRVREDLPVGALISTVTAHDLDEGANGEVTYSFTNGMESHFEMDSLTGSVRIQRKLDYEKQQVYNISVTARDRGQPSLSSRCFILVEVMDVNENLHAPEFSDFIARTAVSENLPVGTYVIQVQASDKDDRSTGVGQVRYWIQDGTGLGRFTIDTNGTIWTNQVLDRERHSHFWLTVIAQDLALVPKFARLEVLIEVDDVNDNIPQSLEPAYYSSVPENNPVVTSVVRIRATDGDFDGGQPLMYAITSGNPQAFFSIDKDTGVLSTTSRTLDREKQDEHSLEITISDRGEPPLSSTTRVLIKVVDENDNRPVFVDPTQQISVFATPHNGTDIFMYRALAYDADEGRNSLVSYVLKSPKDSKLFRVDRKTGKIFSTAELIEGDSFELLIKAVDHGVVPRKSTLRLEVDVNPRSPDPSQEPPRFDQRWYNESIAETDKPGQFIVLLSVQGDVTAKLIYSIEGGNMDDTFTIQPDHGSIFLARHVDWETRTNYTLTVSVTDGLHTDTARVYMDVINTNDNEPVFSHKIYRTNITEEARIGTRMLRVSASDKDRTQRLLYSLVSAASSRSLSKFSIGAESGVLVISDSLDHEDLSRHLLTIMVRDQGVPAKRGFARIDIRVLDSNDHTPRFLSQKFSGQVYETAALGTSVVQALAVDRDKGDNAELEYTILAGNADNAFSIDPLMGIISVNKELDSGVHSKYEMVVRAMDKGTPPLSSTTKVEITVTLSTNSPPTFTQESYSTELKENLPADTVVLSVQADSLSTVIYSISEGNQFGYFNINPNSGVISTLKPVDFEQISSFKLTITATNIISASQTVVVTIHVIDVNDNRPEFQSPVFVGSIIEMAGVGSMVLDESDTPLVIRATDKDSNNNAHLIYTIQDREALKFLAVDPNTGALHTTAQLDYETKSVFNFTVRVQDSGQPQLQAKQDVPVIVKVKDVNDCPPKFDKDLYQVEVLLPTFPDVSVVQVVAADPDTVSDSPLSYSILSGNEDGMFGIDASTGIIHVSKVNPLQTEYRLHVQASDGKFHSVCQVSITVQMESEAGIKFSKDIYQTTVVENKAFEEHLVVVQPIDLPLGSHVTFTLLNNLDLFVVGRTSGVLSTAGTEFDREKKDNYIVVIKAQPNNPNIKSAHAVVQVNVQDENDNSPVFLNLPYRCTVSTNAKPGEIIQKVTATDVDLGVNSELKYTLANTLGDKFAINPYTQEIVVRHLDVRDENKELTLRVIAEDMGSPPMSSVATVHIQVIDSSSPLFEKSSYVGSIPENSAPYTPILTLQANSPYGQKLIYSISRGDKYGDFAVDFNTDMTTLGPCSLSVVGHLDYEDKRQYSLTVRATDIFSGNFAEVMVDIHVEDTNDNPPVFASMTYTQTLSESTSIGTTVISLNSSDADNGPNALVHYSIAPTHPESKDPSYFHIKAEAGEIILKKMLDHERQKEFHFLAVAIDSGMPVQSGTALVTIKVLDLNDNTPTFTQPSYNCYITDLATRGQLVTKLSAFDPDDSDADNLYYRILGGNTKFAFSIDSASGIISLSDKRQPNLDPSYTLNVSVSDGVYTSFTRVVIDVRNSNFDAPSFNKVVYNAVVSEMEGVGTSLVAATATDSDRGNYGMFTYAISDDPMAKLFSIDADTGEIFTKKVLDREEKSIYRFKVSVTDNGGRMGFATIVVRVKDENDNVPKFLMEEYEANVANFAKIGTQIIQVRAVDADEGVNGKIQYSLYQGEDEEIQKLFQVDGESGMITSKAGLQDAENKVFQFFVRVQDQGEPRLENHVPVEILVMSKTSTPPKFSHRQRTSLLSEKEKPETLILTVIARSVTPVTYSLVPGHTPESNNPPQFMINGRGQVYLKHPLDREITPFYTLFVRAQTKTSPPLVDHQELRIQVRNVNDNSPEFTCSPYLVMVPEDSPPQHSIVQLQADDMDEEERSLTFSFGPGMQDMASIFSINSKSGWISLLTELDRERQSEYNLTVLVSDNDLSGRWKSKRNSVILTSTTSVIITVTDVNDNAPTFDLVSYAASVNEASLPGTVVVKLRTMDKDTGSNAEVTYYITEGNKQGAFQIHSNGEVFVNNALDREISSHYRLKVAATDGAFVSLVNVNVEILDDNDNTPVCDQPFYQVIQNEDILMGTAIARIHATDADEKGTDNAKISYSLQGSGADFFRIDKYSGLVVTSKLLDRETRPEFQLTAMARDSGGLSCSTSILIFLKDVNDNAPVFPAGSLRDSYSIKEDAEINTLVTRVVAMDADTGANSQVRYKLSRDSSNAFIIDQDSGIISLMAGLDRERHPGYNLTVIAYNPTSNKLSSEAVVQVIVLDVNDNPPEFERSSYYATLSESVDIGHSVTKVRATSLDIGVNADISYMIAAGNEQGKFSLHKKTGVLRVVEPLDHELSREYFLTVLATDKGTPPLTNTAIISINITDVNDNSPLFSQDTYTVNVLENTDIGTEIFKILATDSDSQVNARITYSILDGNRHNSFTIGPSDGIIQVSELLDREEISSFYLVVQAHDSGIPMLVTTTRVNILVDDANDNAPMFAQDTYKGIVQEGRRTGIDILTLKVTDVDLPENGPPFLYEITKGNDNGEFHIDKEGKLTTAGKLSKSVQERYELTVRVYDNGKPTLHSEKQVLVEVVDDSLYPPEIRDLAISIRACMDGFPGGVIGRVEARDRDPYDKTIFSIVSANSHLFDVHRDDGRLIALTGLDPGNYLINVSVSDGKFTSYGAVKVSVICTSKSMLENAVTIQFENLIEEQFYANFKEDFQDVIKQELGVRSSDVEIINVQPSSSTTTLGRTKRDAPLMRHRRDANDNLDVLFAVRKSLNRFFNKKSLKRKIERIRGRIESILGVKIAGVFTDKCRKNTCEVGSCVGKVKFDESTLVPVLVNGASFVSANHYYTQQCVCLQGVCEKQVCGEKTCSANEVCQKDAFGDYTCQCPEGRTGDDCATVVPLCTGSSCPIERPMTYAGKSYSKWKLQHSTKKRFSLQLRVRTRQTKAVLMYAKGKVDYSILKIESGSLVYKFDCGSGEGVVKIPVDLSDGQWHTIELDRNGREAELSLDFSYTALGVSPGVHAILNVDSEEIFFGAEVDIFPNGYREISKGFEGCMEDIRVFDIPLPFSGSNEVAHALEFELVEFHCQDYPAKFSPGADACSSNPCLNGGQCKFSGLNSYFCVCAGQYTGDKCELNPLPCSKKPCRKGGVCDIDHEVPNSYVCDCKENIIGVRCSYGQFCRPNPCKHGGTCVEGPTAPLCDCPSGYEGLYCDKMTDACESSPCRNGGFCHSVMGGSYFCNCTEHFNGKSCEYEDVNAVAGAIAKSSSGMLYGIISAVLALVLIVVIVIGCFVWQRHKRERRRQNITSGIADSGSEVLLSNIKENRCKLSNPDLSVPVAPFPSQPPPVPTRPASYTPSTQESFNTPNNLDSVRNYGSAGDDLETAGHLPTYYQYLESFTNPRADNSHAMLQATPPPPQPRSKVPSESDSIQKGQWEFEYPNILEHYNEGDKKHQSDKLGAKRMPGIHSPQPSPSIRHGKGSGSDVHNADVASLSSLAESEDDLNAKLPRNKGYHWDISDWAPDPSMPNISEIPIHEILDSPASSQPSDDCNANAGFYDDGLTSASIYNNGASSREDSPLLSSDDQRKIEVELPSRIHHKKNPAANNVISHLDYFEDSDYVGDSEYAENEHSDQDDLPPSYAEHPQYEQLMRDLDNNSYELPAGLHLHPNDYLPHFGPDLDIDPLTEDESPVEGQRLGAEGGRRDDGDRTDIPPLRPPKDFMTPGYATDGYTTDQDPPSHLSFMDDMSMSMGGFTSNNSCSDISGVCEIEDSEVNGSDVDDEYTPLNPDHCQTRV